MLWDTLIPSPCNVTIPLEHSLGCGVHLVATFPSSTCKSPNHIELVCPSVLVPSLSIRITQVLHDAPVVKVYWNGFHHCEEEVLLANKALS